MKTRPPFFLAIGLLTASMLAPAYAAETTPTPSISATTANVANQPATSDIAPGAESSTTAPDTAEASAAPVAPASEQSSASAPTSATKQAPAEAQTTEAQATEDAAGQTEAPQARVQAETPAITTYGAIGARYTADGGEASAPYGKPTANEVCGGPLNSCYQEFERGTIVWSPSTGARLLTGSIRNYWKTAGGVNSSYGIPASDEVSLSNGRSVEQLFINAQGNDGGIYWTNWGTGVHYVNFDDGIGGHWAKDGNFRTNGRYGYPSSDEQCGFTQGSCFQRFESGTIVWSPGNSSVRIGGAIRSTWEKVGGMNSAYGIPVRDEASLSGAQAVEQLFKTPSGKFGAMYWTNWGTGTHYVNFGGAIGSYWANNGNFRAGGIDTPQRYGYPTSEETCTGGRCYQKFQYGVVTWDNFGGGTIGHEAQKCVALNNGRSKYSSQGARQVALALAPRYSTYRNDPVGSHGTFYSCENTYGMYTLKWKTPTAFGESGFLAPWKRINDYETGELLPAGVTGNTAGAYSPTGSFSMSTAFGMGNPGSGFSEYKTINTSSRWGGDRFAWYYNKYVENSALGYPNENLWYFGTRGDYRQGVMINYNRNLDGSVPSGNAGFAIMLHTVPYSGAASTVAGNQSWGCVVIEPNRMTQFLREGRDGDRIIMGVESEVMNW